MSHAQWDQMHFAAVVGHHCTTAQNPYLGIPPYQRAASMISFTSFSPSPCCFGLSGNHLNSVPLQFHTSVVTLAGPNGQNTILRGDVRSIAVVGNNGAGKTEFAHSIDTSPRKVARKVFINAFRDLGYAATTHSSFAGLTCNLCCPSSDRRSQIPHELASVMAPNDKLTVVRTVPINIPCIELPDRHALVGHDAGGH